MKKTIASLSRLGLGVILITSMGAVGQPVPDVDVIDFEDGSQPLMVYSSEGMPDQGALSLTTDPPDVHDGLVALEYNYNRSEPLSILAFPNLLTDVQEIRFWFKSAEAGVWMLYHTDRDGAQFNAFLNFTANTWTEVVLTPSDFALDPNSDVFKPEMEPERNSAYFYAVDVAHVFGVPGAGRVWLDTIGVVRPDMQYVPGPALFDDGQPHVVTEPTVFDGDLVAVNGSQVDLSATRVIVRGNIMSDGIGSTVLVHEGTLRLESQFRYDRQLFAIRDGLLRLENLLLIPGSNLGVSVLYDGHFEYDRTTVIDGALTGTVGFGGRIALRDSVGPGEFVVNSDTTFSAEGIDGVVVWLAADAGVNAQLDVPDETISQWTLGPGWNRDFQMSDIQGANIAILVAEDSQLHVRDGNLRAVGLAFRDFDAEIQGYQNFSYYDQQQFDLPARTLTFENVSVGAWNFYSQGSAHVVVRDCLFGEILTFDQSSMVVFDSVCDGSGGYLGSRHDSRLGMVRSDALCEVVSEGNSRLGIRNGTVLGPVTAAESARIGLDRCHVIGPLYELDDGRIFIR